MAPGMRIAIWNVDGVRAREAQFVEWIGPEQPDVICLLWLGSEGAPTASDSGGYVNSRAAGERRPLQCRLLSLRVGPG